MEYLNYFSTIILIIVFVILVFIYFLSLKNSIQYKVPQISTFNSDFKVLEKYLGKYDLEGKKILDLGSGIGKIIRFFEKKYKMKATGYEIDLGNSLIAKILNKLLKSKAKVVNENYFNAPLKKYDFIYVYLFPSLIDKVEKKIFSEANKGTIVIVNAFKFNNHKPIDIFLKKGKEKIFVYKI